MVNILLINPWIYDFAAYDFWIKPIGLLSIGSVLRKFGYQIFLIDCLDRYNPHLSKLKGELKPKEKKYGTGKFSREPVEKPEILKDIPRRYCRYGIPPEIFQKELSALPRPDVILITSGMTYWYPGVFKAIEIVKDYYPEVPIALGGIYATLCYDHALRNSGADYVIPGEGEYKALQLVDELTGNKSDYSQFPQTLDEYPYPAYDLYPKLASVPIMSSRGCPYRCTFCASHLLSKGYRRRDPIKVVDEIEYFYRKRRVRNFAFFDDALLINREHITKILDEIIRRGIKANFHTPNGIHPKYIDQEMAQKMYRSGFKTLRLSYETSNPQRQKEMGSKVTNDDLVRALNHLEAAGYQRKDIDVYVLMGLPGQSLEEVVESMIFVASLGAKVRLTSFSPIPGTVEWIRAVKEYGFPEDADPLLTNNSIYPLRSKEMGYETFQKLRHLSKVFNNALDQGVNLFDSSQIARAIKKTLIKSKL